MLKASQIINISRIYHEYHTLRKSVGQPGAFAAAVAEVAMAPPPAARRWQQRAPLRQRRTNRAMRRWVRRGHRYLSQQGLQKYILFAYFCVQVFIANLSLSCLTQQEPVHCSKHATAQVWRNKETVKNLEAG